MTLAIPRTDIDDLPKIIQAELSQILKIIKNATIDVKMVWLFGSYARNEQINRKNVRADGVVTEYHSDLDILMVVQQDGTGGGRSKKRNKNEVLRALESSPYIETDVHAIFAEAAVFDRALEEGDFFYSDLVKEGRLLFDEGHPLAQPKKASKQLRRRKSEAYFRKYYKVATSFQHIFEFCYQREDYAIALFNLHQMSEHLLHTMLLVFTNYKPRSHDLNVLGKACAAAYPEIIAAFHGVPYRQEIFKDPARMGGLYHVQSDPAQDTPEQRLWRLLQNAYVNARYDENFKVEAEQAEALCQKVGHLQEVVYRACLKKIQSFLPKVPIESPPLLETLDLERMKSNPMPQAQQILQKQKLDEALEQARASLQREEQALEREEQALEREESERSEKEQALEREEEALEKMEVERSEKEKALEQVKVERSEKERLEALLLQHGIDPGA